MGVSPPGGGVPDSGAKLVRLRRYRSVSISPSSGAENGGQDGPSATYVLPKLAFAGKHCGEFLDKRNTINATLIKTSTAERRIDRPIKGINSHEREPERGYCHDDRQYQGDPADSSRCFVRLL